MKRVRGAMIWLRRLWGNRIWDHARLQFLIGRTDAEHPYRFP